METLWKRWYDKRKVSRFFNEFIFNKYSNNLIILDNAGSHRNDYVKQAILKSGNQFLFSVPYTPKTNAIEMFFNQIKHYLKLNKKVLKFDELQIEVEQSINKVKTQNYFNYFKYAYQKEKYKIYEIKKSTLRRRPKIYKWYTYYDE